MKKSINEIERALRKGLFKDMDDVSKAQLMESLHIYHEELIFQNDELKKNHDEMMVHRDNYRRLFLESPMVYIHTTNEGEVIEWNHKAYYYFHSKESLKKIAQMIHPKDQDRFYFFTKRIKENTQNDAEIFRVNSVLGPRHMKIQCTVSPFSTDRYYTMNDVTKEIEQLDDVIKAKNAATLMNESKNLFLSKISHELRNPINSLSGILTLMGQSQLSHETAGYVDMATERLNQLLHIVNETLDYSMIESGNIDVQRKVVAIDELIEANVTSHEHEAGQKGLKMRFNTTVPAGTRVFMDGAKVTQILDNLIRNAVKYTDFGAITITVGFAGKRLRIEVADTGRGIKPENLKRIFRPFEQIVGPDNRLSNGVGLGLSIVSELVAIMDGEINVSSTYGRGTQFEILLPVDEVVAEKLAKVPEKDSRQSRAIHQRDKGHIRIMIVEDEPISRQVLSLILKGYGYSFDVAENGAEAVALFRKKHHHIIFMDCLMPLMNGYDATKRIRSMKHGKDVKIVAMTALAQEGDKEKCLLSGMDEYMSKPIMDFGIMVEHIEASWKK